MLQGFFPSSSDITKKLVLVGLAVPEGIIMLTIAVILDFIELILFVLSLVGVGIPISFLVNIVGVFTIGLWTILRPIARGAIGRITEKVTDSTLGKIEEKGTPSAGTKLAKKGLKTTKTVAKKGVGLTFTLIIIVVEFIPFLGNIFPGWTIRVIYELVQGEL